MIDIINLMTIAISQLISVKSHKDEISIIFFLNKEISIIYYEQEKAEKNECIGSDNKPLVDYKKLSAQR